MNSIKHPAPFYSLKDAVQELNKTLDFDCYNIQKLLNIALVYDLKLHTYFLGNFDVTVDISYPIALPQENAKYLEVIRITEEIIQAEMMWGTLLEVEYYSLHQIVLFGKAKTNDFGFCNITNLQAEAQNISNFLSHTTMKHRYLKYIEEKEINEIKILAIYPMLKSISEKDFSRPKKYYEFENDESSFIYHPIVRQKDLCITHNQLLRVLNSELCVRDSQSINQKDLEERHDFSKPKGKSDAKEYAQISARAIALHLWKNDKEELIKTGEMCQMVWHTLYDSEYRDELPDKPESIKSWIKCISPEYAKLGGRKKNLK